MIELARRYLEIGVAGRKKLIDYYNLNCYPLVNKDRKYKIKLGDSWCAMFCSVIAHKAGLTREQFPYEVSVFFMTKEAKKRGIFTTKLQDAKINDLVVYDWKANGTLDHVGILLEKGSNYIRVIEGNYSNTVRIRKVMLPNSEVYGYIKTGLGVEMDIEALARDVIKGRYGNGQERKDALGVHYEAVQKRVLEILKT